MPINNRHSFHWQTGGNPLLVQGESSQACPNLNWQPGFVNMKLFICPIATATCFGKIGQVHGAWLCQTLLYVSQLHVDMHNILDYWERKNGTDCWVPHPSVVYLSVLWAAVPCPTVYPYFTDKPSIAGDKYDITGAFLPFILPVLVFTMDS